MDFSLMYQTWLRVVTQPNEATYSEEAEKPDANLSTAMIWIFIASVALGVLSAVAVLVNGLLFNTPLLMGSMFGGSDMPAAPTEQMGQFMLAGVGMNLIFSLILTPILMPIGFLIGSLIYYVFARLLGGSGPFELHTYMLATFTAPLLVVNGALSIIPIVGSCLTFALYFYQMVLTYFAVKTVHNLSPGRAVLVALSPLLIFLFCFILWAIVFFSAFSLAAWGE